MMMRYHQYNDEYGYHHYDYDNHHGDVSTHYLLIANTIIT